MLVGLPLELWASIVSKNGGLLRPCLSSQNFLFLLRMSIIFKFPSIILRNLLLISSAHELEIGSKERIRASVMR
jgi:hypothetical protein